MKLHELYNDGESLKEVRKYLEDSLAKTAVELAMDGSDEVMAIHLTKKFLDSAFEELDRQLGKKPVKKLAPPNEAR